MREKQTQIHSQTDSDSDLDTETDTEAVVEGDLLDEAHAVSKVKAGSLEVRLPRPRLALTHNQTLHGL